MILSNLIQRLDFDAAIVGAGPAGSALAAALASRQLRVLLLERRATPAFRVGETLPPNVGTRLRRLGLWSNFLCLNPRPSYGVLTAWGDADPEAHSYFGHPEGCGWVVDRAAFDQMMRRAAIDAGASFAPPTRLVAIDRGEEEWTLRGASSAGNLLIHARFLVDASGRAAVCAVRLGARICRLDRLVGLVWRLKRDRPAMPTLVEATPTGWWYTAAVPGGAMVAVFLAEADMARRLHRPSSPRWPTPCLSGAPLTAERLRSERPPGAPLVFPAFTQALEPAAGDGWLAVGDAAVGRDPISGSGIDFALATAEIASQVIVCAFGGDRFAHSLYASLIRRDFESYIEERRSVYVLEARWPEAPFWRQRRAATTLAPPN